MSADADTIKYKVRCSVLPHLPQAFPIRAIGLLAHILGAPNVYDCSCGGTSKLL